MEPESVIITCPRCGTKNRVPKGRLHDHPVCAKCRNPLTAEKSPGRPVEVTDRNFQNEILSYPGPVVLDCWAPWCGPCRMVGPVIDQLAAEYAGRVKFAKLNTDENQRTAGQFSIQSIPTLLFFKGGKLVNRQVGALPKAAIERQMQAIL
ncbi:MAG TPA: thioredoxin TrxC [Thermodesulfobacteriota bacterium]|nr:thioredoxin TrxC [Thermodesulfobacteriota bacterium]